MFIFWSDLKYFNCSELEKALYERLSSSVFLTIFRVLNLIN